jgi:hypothetical protein
MTVRGFLVMAACLSCLGCRAADPAKPKYLASSADSPQAAGSQSLARNSVVYVYYFHQTFRCLSCQMTEEMAVRATQEHFAQPVQTGLVVWMPVNIDKPGGKTLRQQFDVRATDLVLARMEDGVCKESKKLDELAGLTDRPDAFSKYLVDQINTYLSSVQSK